MVELGLTAGFVTTKITRHPQVACFSGRLNLMRDNNACGWFPIDLSWWFSPKKWMDFPTKLLIGCIIRGQKNIGVRHPKYGWTQSIVQTTNQEFLGQNEGYLALDDFGFLKGDLPIWSIEWSLPFRSHVGSVGCQPPPFTIKVVPPNYVFCFFGL